MIFYFIFLSQIIYISWYIPRMITKRMQKVRETYPPSEFPKLYLKPGEDFKKAQERYSFFNRILFTMGFSLISAIAMWDYLTAGELSQMIPWAYFMLQMLPLMWLEISEFKSFKAMRLANTNTTKKANIRPRKLFDFISPKLLIFAIAMLLLAFALVFFRFGLGNKLLINMVVIIVANLFFSGIAYWNIYGKKLDPYQSSEDRLRQIKVTVKSLVFISIGVSVFFSVQMLINIFQLNYLETSMMSIYCQLLVWGSVGTRFKEYKLENINFNVYRDNENKTNDNS